MIDLLERNRMEIAALCERYRVKLLHVFGSAATGAFDDARSDVDLLVEFHPLQPGERADAYFGLLEDLQSLLGRHVDLVVSHAVRNPFLREAIEQTRETLYAS